MGLMNVSNMLVECNVCFHKCKIPKNGVGFCRSRTSDGIKIVPRNYGKITGLALDPIEKKPLARFMPGSWILSVGSFGCNLSCPFCQNHEISQSEVDFRDQRCREVSPEALAEIAAQERDTHGNVGLAYTYNEAMVGYEFVRDTSRLIHARGMVNVLVTNGTAGQEALSEVLPYMDAMNIDLKVFSEEGYRRLGGDFTQVQEFIWTAARSCHVEITTLIVPGLNDDAAMMRAEAQWLAEVEQEAGKRIPLHLTRYFPRYKMTDGRPTEVQVLYELADAARESLEDVLLGNI